MLILNLYNEVRTLTSNMERIIKKIDNDLIKIRHLQNDLTIVKSLLEERLKINSEEKK